jgi:hypothetical protein
MAATDLARGRVISVSPTPDEITYFLLAKEFGWLPSQIKKESSKDIKGVLTVMSIYNKVRNSEIERANKRNSGKPRR